MVTAAPNPTWLRRLAWRLGHAALVVAILFAALSMSSSPPTKLGLHSGRLAPCPATPNCVSSSAEREAQKVSPLILDRPISEAQAAVKQVIAGLPRTRLVREESDYLHFEFRSLIFRFVDDVEFHFDAKAKSIHVRSASRVGHSDLGVNRRRVEAIRSLLPVTMQGQRE